MSYYSIINYNFGHSASYGIIEINMIHNMPKHFKNNRTETVTEIKLPAMELFRDMAVLFN